MSEAKRFIISSLITRVDRLMDNRRRLLAPFPIAAEQLYRLAWTPEERAAIRVLARRKGMLSTSKHIHLTGFKIRDRLITINVSLKHPLPVPGYYLSMNISHLPPEVTKPIGEWASLWQDLKSEQSRIIGKLEDIAGVCSTYGQLYRLWPDILSMFDSQGRKKIEYAASKSPLPVKATVYRVGEGDTAAQRVLADEYKPEAFEPFTNMIAECLMLPMDESAVEVARII